MAGLRVVVLFMNYNCEYSQKSWMHLAYIKKKSLEVFAEF